MVEVQAEKGEFFARFEVAELPPRAYPLANGVPALDGLVGRRRKPEVAGGEQFEARGIIEYCGGFPASCAVVAALSYVFETRARAYVVELVEESLLRAEYVESALFCEFRHGVAPQIPRVRRRGRGESQVERGRPERFGIRRVAASATEKNGGQESENNSIFHNGNIPRCGARRQRYSHKKSFSNRAFALISSNRFFYGQKFLPHHRNRLCQRLPAPRARLREDFERRRRPPQAHVRNPDLLSDGARRARAEGAAERASRGRRAVGSLRQAGREIPEPLQNPQRLQRRLHPHFPAAAQGGRPKNPPRPLRPRGNLQGRVQGVLFRPTGAVFAGEGQG